MSNSQDEQSSLFSTITETVRAQKFSKRTEQRYLFWMRKFIYFHKERNPKTLQEAQIQDFLNYLVLRLEASSSTQNIALKAVFFMYKHVLDKPLVESKIYLHRKKCTIKQSVAA